MFAKELYETTNPVARIEVEKTLVQFVASPDCLNKCQFLLERGTVLIKAFLILELILRTFTSFLVHIWLLYNLTLLPLVRLIFWSSNLLVIRIAVVKGLIVKSCLLWYWFYHPNVIRWWQYCFYVQSPYAQLLAATTLTKLITRANVSLPLEQRIDISRFHWNYVNSLHSETTFICYLVLLLWLGNFELFICLY